MDMYSVSTLKATLPIALKRLKKRRRPVLVVNNGQPEAVIQDVKSYQQTQDAIALLKMMLQAEYSISAKRGASTRDVLERLRVQ